jgi:hypothetical protein
MPGCFPDVPTSWSDLPGTLLDALAAAARTSTDDTGRFALNWIQLQGERHDVVATDGHQLLVSGGFVFPCASDALIRHVSVFASSVLPRAQPLSIRKTDTHVVLRAGFWTFFLEVQPEARFPRRAGAFRRLATASRLCLDTAHATFLRQALERLPGADERYSPVTLDRNGRIAV